MQRDINIIEYVPDVLKPVREFKSIMNVENPELVLLWKRLANALDDNFLLYSTEYGISRWEKILSISPKDTETLEERRFKILSHLNSNTIYTLRTLKTQLELLCGKDGYEVFLYPSEYRIRVFVALNQSENFNSVNELLKQILPANMIYELTLKYNFHNKFVGFKHSEMAAKTHNQIRSEFIE